MTLAIMVYFDASDGTVVARKIVEYQTSEWKELIDHGWKTENIGTLVGESVQLEPVQLESKPESHHERDIWFSYRRRSDEELLKELMEEFERRGEKE